MASIYDVHSVIVIPHDGDPHGLIHIGAYGDRPPMVFCDHRVDAFADWQPHVGSSWAVAQSRRALVVAENHTPIPQGWTLVERARGRGRSRAVEHALRCVLLHGTREALYHFRHRTCAGLGAVVYLDEYGKEVGE